MLREGRGRRRKSLERMRIPPFFVLLFLILEHLLERSKAREGPARVAHDSLSRVEKQRRVPCRARVRRVEEMAFLMPTVRGDCGGGGRGEPSQNVVLLFLLCKLSLLHTLSPPRQSHNKKKWRKKKITLFFCFFSTSKKVNLFCFSTPLSLSLSSLSPLSSLLSLLLPPQQHRPEVRVRFGSRRSRRSHDARDERGRSDVAAAAAPAAGAAAADEGPPPPPRSRWTPRPPPPRPPPPKPRQSPARAPSSPAPSPLRKSPCLPRTGPCLLLHRRRPGPSLPRQRPAASRRPRKAPRRRSLLLLRPRLPGVPPSQTSSRRPRPPPSRAPP